MLPAGLSNVTGRRGGASRECARGREYSAGWLPEQLRERGDSLVIAH
jgi:hypothetical protein